MDCQSVYCRFCECLLSVYSRRCIPELVYSDNASQFVKCHEALKIPWNFTTPHAPWLSGLYERLIEIMKQCLRRMVGKRLLSISEFDTVILQVDGILGSRPLTPVSDDSIEALTLNDLLLPKTQLFSNTPEAEAGRKGNFSSRIEAPIQGN